MAEFEAVVRTVRGETLGEPDTTFAVSRPFVQLERPHPCKLQQDRCDQTGHYVPEPDVHGSADQ